MEIAYVKGALFEQLDRLRSCHEPKRCEQHVQSTSREDVFLE
jgi:hypothetical protein